jgi:hypothetical protein
MNFKRTSKLTIEILHPLTKVLVTERLDRRTILCKTLISFTLGLTVINQTTNVIINDKIKKQHRYRREETENILPLQN